MIGYSKQGVSLSLFTSITFWFFFASNLSTIIQQSVLSNSSFGEMIYVGSYLILLGVILLFWLKIRIRLVNMIVIATIMTFNVLGYLIMGSTMLLYLTLFGMLLQKQSEKKILYYNMTSAMFLFVAVITLALTGLLNNNLDSNGVRLLGFSNKNHPPLWIMMIIVCFNILYEVSQDGVTRSLPLKMILAESILFGVTYYLFKCRTAMFVAFIYMCGLTVANFMDRKKIFRIIMNLLQYMFIFSAGISYYVAVHYETSNNYMIAWNVFFSGRLSMSHEFIRNYPITLFGNKLVADMVSGTSGKKMPLDNAYLGFLLERGLIIFVIHVFLFLYISRYAYKRKRWILLISTVAYELYFMFESIMGPAFCPVLLLSIVLLMNRTPYVHSLKKCGRPFPEV